MTVMKALLSSGFLALLFFGAVINHAPVSGFSLGNHGSRTALSISSHLIARGSFVSNGFSNQRRLLSAYCSRHKTSAMHMVIDRLSFECIEAVKQSHDIGHEIGLKTLRNEILFAGIVAKPERAQKILEKYGITAEDVKKSAIKKLRFQSGVELSNPDPTNKDALPFSPDTKTILSKACEIADRMESQVVRSEHVLLALMGYNNGNDIEEVPVVEVLREMTSIQKAGHDFTVSKFCYELVQSLPLTPVSGKDVVVKDTVVIGGQG
jgi:hypothetical protein